jgi:hypothetical protein
MAGGEPRRLTETGPVIFGITWSSDGQELVYSQSEALWRRRIDKPDSMKSARIDGVVERALEPVIASRLQGNAQRLAYEQAVLDTNV